VSGKGGGGLVQADVPRDWYVPAIQRIIIHGYGIAGYNEGQRMPTILRLGKYRFHFYSDEGNESPHIHVRSPEGECKFWQDPVQLARNNGIAAHELRAIERHVFEHREMLMEKYNEFHGR